MKQSDVIKYKPKDKRYDVRDDLMRSLILRVEPSGKKSWLLDYTRPDGRRNTVKLGDARQILSPSVAREIAKEKLIEVAKGLDPNDKLQDLTLCEYIERYYKPWIMVNQKTPEYAISTLNRDFAWLLDKPLNKITLLEIDTWRAAEKAKNKAATVNRKITVLKAALNWAVDHSLLSKNPLDGSKSLKEIDSLKKIRYLLPEEKERLLAALKDNKTYLYPLVLLSLNTGIRRKALFNLHWDDVDLKSETIVLRAESAKNTTFSVLPLNKTAVKILKEWKKSRINNLVFPSVVTKGEINNCKKAWATLLKKAEITDFRWHDMRHDFASQLVMKAVDLNTVRELMTHSDIRMTQRYAHLAPDIKKTAVTKLD